MQNQLRTVRLELTKENMSMDKIFTVLKVLHYFERFLSMEDVRMAVSEADDLMTTFVIQQREIIESETLRGTSCEHNFGVANVAAIKRSLTRLQALKCQYLNDVDCAMIESFIKEKIEEFENQLVIDCWQNFGRAS